MPLVYKEKFHENLELIVANGIKFFFDINFDLLILSI
jgi:hypothetical protein